MFEGIHPEGEEGGCGDAGEGDHDAAGATKKGHRPLLRTPRLHLPVQHQPLYPLLPRGVTSPLNRTRIYSVDKMFCL